MMGRYPGDPEDVAFAKWSALNRARREKVLVWRVYYEAGQANDPEAVALKREMDELQAEADAVVAPFSRRGAV